MNISTFKEVADLLQHLLHTTKNEKVYIFSDHDADGITSGSILYLFLNQNKNLSVQLNHTDYEVGHGISDAITEDNPLIKCERGSYVFILDSGSDKDYQVIAAMLDLKNLVIVDHHEVDPEIPYKLDNIIRVNPQDSEEFKGYCTAHIMYALTQSNNPYLGLLASIGTIGDLQPLKELNYELIKTTLDNLENSSFISSELGFTSLIKYIVTNSKNRNRDLLNVLSSRLNAMSRLGYTVQAFQFCTNDKVRYTFADEAAKERTKLIRETEFVELAGNKYLKIYTCSAPKGIVSALATKKSKEANETCLVGVGNLYSARSDKYNIKEYLNRHPNIIARGHAQACGVDTSDLIITFKELLTDLEKSGPPIELPKEEVDLSDTIILDNLKDLLQYKDEKVRKVLLKTDVLEILGNPIKLSEKWYKWTVLGSDMFLFTFSPNLPEYCELKENVYRGVHSFILKEAYV